MRATTSGLAQACMVFAARGANEYLRVNKLTADKGALAECLAAWIKIKLPEALADAKEALECNMGQVAEATFAATMASAGIEAAKEASKPTGVQS